MDRGNARGLGERVKGLLTGEISFLFRIVVLRVGGLGVPLDHEVGGRVGRSDAGFQGVFGGGVDHQRGGEERGAEQDREVMAMKRREYVLSWLRATCSMAYAPREARSQPTRRWGFPAGPPVRRRSSTPRGRHRRRPRGRG